MPSPLHEMLVLLFRNRPQLAAELLSRTGLASLPTFVEAHIDTADLNEVETAELRADLVVLLCAPRPVAALVVEIQLREDPRKRYTWPAYAAVLRRRRRCPALVLVFTVDEKVARWAAKPIPLGGQSVFQPVVLGPGGVPVIVDAEDAERSPELAVLSAMAHGRDEPEQALAIALTAIGAAAGLEHERGLLYFDMVFASLGEAAREALSHMDPAKYQFQSEFAKHYIQKGLEAGRSEGRELGRSEGEVRVVARLLERRFGPLPESVVARLQSASSEQLERWAERLLNAPTLEDVFDDTGAE